MRFVKAPIPSISSAITRGHYVNSRGKTTHHPRKATTPIEFYAVDGEGITTTGPSGGHKYVLLGVGSEQYENDRGTLWSDAFRFLYDQYRPRTAFVGFYLGYDFTQILRTLPEDKAWMLLTAEGRALRKHRIPGKPTHPVDCGGWQFDLLGSKRLRLRPKSCDCVVASCKCGNKQPWMYICDVGGFFQSSFLSVIDPRKWPDGTAPVTDSEYSLILAGKQRRSTAVLDDDMRMYNRLENDVLARVMRTLDTGLHDIGIHLPPAKWFGPGQVAQAWLKKVEAPTRERIEIDVPVWFREAARMSYFGGWFEIMAHGIIPGDSHEYDINSAYPSIIRGLPCLLHGRYSHGVNAPIVDNDDYCLVYAQVRSPSGRHSSRVHVGAMLHRDTHGRILRPMATEGWYWWHEVQAARRAGCVTAVKVLRWVKYTPCDCPPPMREIEGLYQKRLEVGKTSPLGKAAKLTYNSAYGKFAQSVGAPLFGNPVYASLITSGCRTMILNAIATHPRGKANVTMVATDAVYFLDPHPGLPISENLGEWDYKIRRNLTLFKPGVYWHDDARQAIARGEIPSFKARGFNAADFGASIARIDEIFHSWNDAGAVGVGGVSGWEWPTVTFRPAFAMTTALQALRRGKWWNAGAVETRPVELTQDSNPADKRTGLWRSLHDGRIIYRSEPYSGLVEPCDQYPHGVVPSTPYEKRFGMEDPWSDEYQSTLGEHPEGPIGDMLAWILKGE